MKMVCCFVCFCASVLKSFDVQRLTSSQKEFLIYYTICTNISAHYMIGHKMNKYIEQLQRNSIKWNSFELNYKLKIVRLSQVNIWFVRSLFSHREVFKAIV